MPSLLAIPFKSYADVDSRLVNNTAPEGLYWDYKENINFSKDTAARELAVDIAAFANTLGGSILIGISEGKNTRGLKVASGYCPVVDPEKIKKKLNEQVRDFLKPYISFETIVDCDNEGKNCIVIVNVQPSAKALVGVTVNRDTHAVCFPYRTEYGNRYYQFHEVEERMNMSDRAMFLKAAQFFNKGRPTNVKIYPLPIISTGRRAFADVVCTVELINDNDHVFKITLKNRCINLPFSMIEEIWDPYDNGREISVKLKETIVFDERLDKLDLNYGF